jgi:biopolymer transport protein ExbB
LFGGHRRPPTTKNDKELRVFGIVQTIGWPIWPLIFASVIALALVIERSLALRRHQVIPPNLLKELVPLIARRQITGDVLEKLHASSLQGRIFAAGVRRAGAPRAQISQSMELAGGQVAHELSRYLALLGAIGSVAPLLGLLGTVVGMIDIFSSQQGGANPQQLAQGISIALYSTAFGIIVAVPSVLAYRIFKSRVDDFLIEMERQGQELLDLLDAAAGTEARTA